MKEEVLSSKETAGLEQQVISVLKRELSLTTFSPSRTGYFTGAAFSLVWYQIMLSY